MSLQKDQVVVLKSTNFGEADKILTVFGKEHGKFTVFARGVRKIESRNRGSIQTLSIADINFYRGQGMANLRESSSSYVPEINKEHLDSVQKVLFLLNKFLPEDEKENEIYEKLSKLVRGSFNLREVNSFRINFLRLLGYLPEMNLCNNCGRSDELTSFIPTEMCVLCKECSKKAEGGIKMYNLKDCRFESKVMDGAINRFVAKIVENA